MPNLDLIQHFTRILPDGMEVRFKIFSFSKCLLACLYLLIGFTQGKESYIAVESYSGKIVLELDADKRRPVASLTKIATAMVVLDWAKLSGTSMAEIAIVPQGTVSYTHLTLPTIPLV